MAKAYQRGGSFDGLPWPDLLDNIDAGISVYDREGNFIFVNAVMINWRNIPRHDYLRMNVRDFTNYIDVCVFDLVMEKRQRVSRLQFYRDLQSQAATPRMRIVTGTPLFDENGEIRYVVTLLQDIERFESLYHTLLQETHILRDTADLPAGPEKEADLVVESPELSQVLSIAKSIAPLDSSVLLYGESGSGKEVFARFIHRHSQRRDAPLITVNCGAFPENLMESELFGYEKGSFTGASREGKVGLIEAADGGTLFLDEINSLPLAVQGKLLRVIEEKTVLRIGAVKPKRVDFRLIAATNRPLNELVRKNSFREDLYYRLHVIPLTIPPIRNRRDDIIPLCQHFLSAFCRKYNRIKRFSPAVLEQLKRYSWPGNVREIRNFVERMVVMTPSETTVIKSIPAGMLAEEGRWDARPPGETAPPPPAPKAALGKEEILQALALCGENRTRAARYLGISRRYLQYKLREYGIAPRYGKP